MVIVGTRETPIYEPSGVNPAILLPTPLDTFSITYATTARVALLNNPVFHLSAENRCFAIQTGLESPAAAAEIIAGQLRIIADALDGGKEKL